MLGPKTNVRGNRDERKEDIPASFLEQAPVKE
jgi:hypothetical protein